MSRSLVLATALLAASASGAELCSPFDKDPANASVVGGREATGDIAADQPACCDGRTTDDGCGPQRCPPVRNVGAPVDTLNGFAWLERTDVEVPQPWGPAVRFTRHYSTAWAQGAGSTSDVGPIGPGWSHSWAAHLSFGPGLPASRVVLRNADTSSEEYNLRGAAYVSRHASRTLSWDEASQLYTAERPDGSALVFDAQGRLKVVRSADGGEAHLRYAGDDASCQPSSTLPPSALCRIDFLFERQLWFKYEATGRLSAVAWDAAFSNLVVGLEYTNGQLTAAVAADGTAEAYAYEFNHQHLTSSGVTVPLLTKVTDADGKVVEQFSYVQPAASPSRVSSHATPEATYTFTWAYLDTTRSPQRVVRKTRVRGTRENLELTWADGALTSVCRLDANGNCDVTRRREYVRAPGFLEVLCEQKADGHFRRSERDALGRVVAEYPGLTACDEVTDSARARGHFLGWLGSTSKQAWEAWPSVDPSAPAGFKAFRAWDYTVPANAIDPFCGGTSCQRPEAYNAGPLTPRVQRRIEVGRTLLDVDGTWGVQVQVTSYGFDAQGRPTSVDGPRRDVSDVRTLTWSPTTPWALERVTLAGRVLAEFSNYDRLGNARTVVDENGNTTTRQYDLLGRFLGEQLPGQHPSTMTRLPSGRVDTATEPSGVVTQYGWNGDGQLGFVKRWSRMSGAPDSELLFERRSRQLRALTLRDSGTTVRASAFEYDSQGRLERVDVMRDAQSIHRLTRFDEDGRFAWMADEGRLKGDVLSTPEAAKSHEYRYDAFGNLAEVLQKMEGGWTTVARYTWDARGNLASVTDAKGVTVRYVHDDFGRLVEVESPDFGLFRTVYDEAGNVSAERRPDGTVVRYEYDASNRLVAVKVGGDTVETYDWGTEAVGVADCADGSPLPATQSKGRVSHVHDDSGDWYFGYWPSGQKRFEAHVRPGKSCAKTIFFEYDAGGLLTAIRYPSGARVEFDYPASGQALKDRPSGVALVVGGQRTALLTNVQWQAGEVAAYTTQGGVTWKLSRWLEGSAAQVTLTRGTSTPNVVRQRKFGKTEGGRFASSFDGWGNPLDIEEATPSWSQHFSTNDFPALTGASGFYGTQSFSYLASGDRHEANGESYCYERGTHRLSSVGVTRFSWRADGSLARREAPDGAALTFCYDARGRISSTVGAGGDVTHVVTNFRGQRVAELWAVNGLREDFLVDEMSRLLSEEGVGALDAQYPRPVREYVWLGMHPVAVLESTEDAAGIVTPKGVTYVHSGHLGEPLTETDEGGRVLRHWMLTPFGERLELPPPAIPVSFETANP